MSSIDQSEYSLTSKHSADPCEECLQRQEQLIALLQQAGSDEQRMRELIRLGRALPQLPRNEWTETRRVQGCQSLMFLKMTFSDTAVHIEVGSDALIAAGLAALVLTTYQGCSAEQILRCPFIIAERVNLAQQLTPGRSNGLESLLREVKRVALQRVMQGS